MIGSHNTFTYMRQRKLASNEALIDFLRQRLRESKEAFNNLLDRYNRTFDELNQLKNEIN